MHTSQPTDSQHTPVDISVATHYQSEQSLPDEQRHVFTYTITITNISPEPVRLLSRHWVITDGNNSVREVRGEGVVGQQPLIDVGQSFQYTSGAVLETDMGVMEGSYAMITQSGDTFSAPIAAFTLCRPGVIFH
jgi:ApaG protein